MTYDEFLSTIKSHGAEFAPPATINQITFTNATLQQRRHAMIPQTLIDIFTHTGGINLNGAYIFGPNEIARTELYPTPSILQINADIAPLGKTVGKTIFGRNDLFYFAFDAFGAFYLLDNITLNPLRKYDDVYRAISDCLIAGKL
ncbi:MAG: hypothetical protein II208_03220 [Alphaproteobacteria bacterium]|nr:hypothetical protein [Alphaproteobacteria bacterium]